MLSFMVVMALIPVLYSGPLTQAFPWFEEAGIWITAVTLTVLAAMTFLMMRRDIVIRLLGFLTKSLSPKRARFVEHITHSFLDGFLFLKEPKSYAMIILLSILVWVLYIVMVYLPFLAFGLGDRLDWAAAFVIQAISSIGFMLPTPGATGSYHYFVIQTMTKLYGVDQEVARSYATVTHAVGFLGTMAVGIYFFLRDKLHLSDVARGAVADTPPSAEPEAS